jgi:hypothetical protein
MPDDMLRFVIDCARRNLAATVDWYKDGDGTVQAIKQELDAAYAPQFHVVIGKHFGSKVTHEVRTARPPPLDARKLTKLIVAGKNFLLLLPGGQGGACIQGRMRGSSTHSVLTALRRARRSFSQRPK